jgi:hypothetical protein
MPITRGRMADSLRPWRDAEGEVSGSFLRR